MRTIRQNQIGTALQEFLADAQPLEADIGIQDQNGQLLGVIISPDAYDFFLAKLEEAEDSQDRETVENFRLSKG